MCVAPPRRSHGPTESNRKRKLGGNSSDFRPYFTYWITTVQLLVLFISMLVYGCGPLGVDRYKKTGMVSISSPFYAIYRSIRQCCDFTSFLMKPLPFQVLVTNLELESVGHHEPANFWFGPSAVRDRTHRA